ncbi:hypothetical protein CLAFUW4_12450 [Fulvia fulva]|uniref:Uncharacterized protein n=1 Tax=Passalora fulva TaxID=5499 RepID=A0A9Q8PF52_PASFU|nr:uncharacterized protein CLAFUR5_11478 [Fulvia fulva]KAK4617579.1 hypothetical protein CLAFUR4_12455 [Fulvia fulva]KAK4619001.1 hypothetical protein CLAFUR0_12466 [Fulvia fulva]UJO21272.1 hypothetical protein CLAFUR5_11478 [Fulvia fulva]WPV18482.1 hypothetical protein CLAFUW4_12450 [Fulvia fulva]WPV33043.1 hypothetical protein CLAFUW7_12457 [Fulvia fulva]
MPRTLPWLTGASEKREAPRKAQSEKPARKRSSSPGDLVNSDLEPIGSSSSSPERKPKKRPYREPSSSPPPAKVAPLVEYMREGFTMDDRYMMVEDEFTSTARLFSLPLHQDEYDRARRRAKARGAETLRMIGHGTDGTTGQSRPLRLKLEAEGMVKKRKDAGLVDDDEEDFMADPQLAGLMTASHSTPRKSLKGFASNSQRTPRVAGGRTRDVYRRPDVSAIEEDEETEDEDEHDLDVFATRGRHTASTSAKHAALATKNPAMPEPEKKVGIFKQFARPAQAERERKDEEKRRTVSPTRNTNRRDSVKPAAVRDPSPRRKESLSSTSSQAQPAKMSRAATIIARRREAEKQARREALSPDKQFKEELQSQVVKEERDSQTQGRTHIKREPSPSPVRQALASKSMAQRRAERAKKGREDKQKSQLDDIPTFLF